MAKNKAPQATTIFYSWQSDFPKKTNLNAIRAALKKASRALEAADPALKLVPDEATRDTSGRQHRAQDPRNEKIEAAEVFIADVTTITPPGADRPGPNPNVGYELGYAVAMLGWDRVILLFNDKIGNFPAHLPFDFVQNLGKSVQLCRDRPCVQRQRSRRLPQDSDQGGHRQESKWLVELKGLTREKIRHDHDVENMRWLMRTLHIPTLQDHIESLPHAITGKALWFFETFRGVAANALFSVYDPVLSAAVDKLHQSWSAALAHDNEYHDTPSGKIYVFTNPGDMPLSGERQEAWDAIDAARREMAEAITVILDRLRSDYLEIKIKKTNKRAWEAYVADQRDETKLLRKLKRSKKKKGV